LTIAPSQPKQRHCGGGGGGRWRWHKMMMAQNGCAQPGEEGQKHEGWGGHKREAWGPKHEGWGQRCGRNAGEEGPRHEHWKRWWAARQNGSAQPGEEGQKQEGWGQRHGGWGGRCGPRGKFFFLQKQGLRLLETGTQENIQAAKILFQEQLAIFEHHTPIYNIACCEALLGNSKDALVFLKKAVDAGFRDVNHIENDADLKSLRHLDEYKAIIAAAAVKPANSSNSSSAPSAPVVVPEVKPEPEITKPEVKAPEIAVPAPSAPSGHEANLVALENMGFAERSKNLEALERAKGDIVVAVQLLVDAQRLYKWF